MATIHSDGGLFLNAYTAGAGRPFVMLHGWSLSHRAFQCQLTALAARFRVVAPDLRGHGSSQAPAGPFTVEDFAGDLVAVFRDLGLDGAVLAGWSWGAEVAIAAFPALRERVAGVALLSATPRFTSGEGWPHGVAESRVRALRARLARAPDEARRAFLDGMFTAGEVTPEERERVVGEQLTPAPDVGAARATLDALAATDLRDRLEPLRGVPALLVHGEQDPVCLPAASAWLHDQLPGSRRTVIPGAGHAPQLSRPAVVTDLLARFAEALA